MPRVCVLVNTYNHERFIAQALESVCAQTFPASEMEVVIVDDGSTDGTPEIARKFAPRVRLLRKKNGGQASAFNAAISELHADLIAFLDGDDWWAPEKLSAVAEAFEQNPHIPAVGHAFYDTAADGTLTELVVPENMPVSVCEISKRFAARRSGNACSPPASSPFGASCWSASARFPKSFSAARTSR